jgi:CBS domain-containing protein
MRLQVKDFMSKPVITVMLDETILEVRTLIKEKGIHAFPVVSYTNDNLKVEETIKGIITSNDITEEVSDDAEVSDIMTSGNVLVAHVDTNAKSAAKMMLKHRVHHIVAMDDGEIKGMISSLDFVKLVADQCLE